MNMREFAESKVDMVDPIRGDKPWCRERDVYVTLCCGGIKPQAESLPLLGNTSELVEAYWKQSFEEYLASLRIEGPKVLHWRMFPEIHKETIFFSGDTTPVIKYWADARLVVTGI